MKERRPLGITLIGYFYIFGAIVLLASLFSNDKSQFGFALRFGFPNAPENIMKVAIAILSFIISYGYLKLKKWGYWLMIVYTLYFLVVSSFLAHQYKSQPFYGNVIWSIMVLVYSLSKRKYFVNV